MANQRMIHKEAATGDRTTELDAFEFRVWVQYQLSADDFGVCPAVALKFQGENRWLAKQRTAKVQAAIERLVVVNLVQVFSDKGTRYLYQWDWQDWQRFKYATVTSLPPVPGELLEKCSPKTAALFAEYHPKIRQTFSHRAGAPIAPANANASVNSSLEESRETFLPPKRGGTLLTSPLDWDRKHGAHVSGFCDWVCFPNDLRDEFARKVTGMAFEDASTQVDTWARETRQQWQGRIVPDGSYWDFWKHRWTETHGGSKPMTSAGFDPLAGVRKAKSHA